MDEQRLLAQLQKSPKYAAIGEETLRRVLSMMAPRYKRDKDVLEAAKRHLHVITGMYLTPPELARAAALLAQAASSPCGDITLVEISRELLTQHASTRERLPDVAGFYGEALAGLPPPERVLDLGCGFQPFARPFMPIPAQADYAAYDLLPEMAALIETYFVWAELPGNAGVLDLLDNPPPGKHDLALLMKLLPVLEQQRKGAGAALLAALPAQYALVTFPTRSIGGRGGRGMAATWAAWMEHHLPGGWRILRRAEIGQELLYVLQRQNEEESP